MVAQLKSSLMYTHHTHTHSSTHPPHTHPPHTPTPTPTHSFELRELEAKLKAGYMNKERAAQLAEKDTLRKKEEVCCVVL